MAGSVRAGGPAFKLPALTSFKRPGIHVRTSNPSTGLETGGSREFSGLPLYLVLTASFWFGERLSQSHRAEGNRKSHPVPCCVLYLGRHGQVCLYSHMHTPLTKENILGIQIFTSHA